MTERATEIVLRHLSQDEFRARTGELLEIYVAAMRYPKGTAQARAALWLEHSNRPGFDCVVALDDTPAGSGYGAGTLRGLAYGYRGLPGQWWHNEVRRGLSVTPRQGETAPPSSQAAADRTGWLDHYVELTELHVRPDSQGGGLGEAMLRALVADRAERMVLLSTPEGSNRAWRLYRRLGFADVLRDFRFAGDPRPFAVLGRPLPLGPPHIDDAAGPTDR